MDETYLWSGAFSALSFDDQLSVAKLIRDGGAIKGSVEEIVRRIARARIISLLRVSATNHIVGVSALKTPSLAYREAKFSAAKFPMLGYEGAPELGYVVVAEVMRGRLFSGVLVDSIVKDINEPIFATTDDRTMKNNLKRSGFAEVGQEWRGHKAALSLWVTPIR